MTDTDNLVHPQNSGADPTYIRILINQKIRIQITDHLCFNF